MTGSTPGAVGARDERRPDRIWLHGLLFFVSFVCATIAQLPVRSDLPWGRGIVDALLYGPALVHGLLFSVTLMAILVAHEMGHFLVAARNGVEQSLPYFIPAPTFVGTLGAVILMRSEPPDRAVLLKVAVGGPFAGLLVALPATVWGLAHSQPTTLQAIPPGEVMVGTSLLFGWLQDAFGPGIHGGLLNLHPVALAGWTGLLLTSLNLLPVAQLDGGHVAYALVGARQKRLSAMVVIGLFVLGAVAAFPGADGIPRWGGLVWVFWALVLFVVGTRHPPVSNPARGLGWGQQVLGLVALVVFVLTFVPVPVSLRAASTAPRHEMIERIDDLPADPPPAEEFDL